ncbi:MAG: XisI protein [Byssovorax sp.]
MDSMTEERAIIRRCLREYVDIRYINGDIRNETVFDEENARYLVVSQGWMGAKRTHGCLLHVEIVDGKIWIQRDGTEEGIAGELVAAGIPKDRIVLGFWDAEARKLGEFAAA